MERLTQQTRHITMLAPFALQACGCRLRCVGALGGWPTALSSPLYLASAELSEKPAWGRQPMCKHVGAKGGTPTGA